MGSDCISSCHACLFTYNRTRTIQNSLPNIHFFKADLRKTGLSPPSILILTVPRRYFCCGSLQLLVLAVRIYTLFQLLC